MIFNVKMSGLVRKVHLADSGLTTQIHQAQSLTQVWFRGTVSELHSWLLHEMI